MAATEFLTKSNLKKERFILAQFEGKIYHANKS